MSLLNFNGNIVKSNTLINAICFPQSAQFFCAELLNLLLFFLLRFIICLYSNIRYRILFHKSVRFQPVRCRIYFVK